jgi:hypothetical protein
VQHNAWTDRPGMYIETLYTCMCVCVCIYINVKEAKHRKTCKKLKKRCTYTTQEKTVTRYTTDLSSSYGGRPMTCRTATVPSRAKSGHESPRGSKPGLTD